MNKVFLLSGFIQCHTPSNIALLTTCAPLTSTPPLGPQGSGISEGEYVTLGAHEVEDLEVLVEFIRAGGHTSVVALWGRSMGAVTALQYSEQDPSVAALVLDSPFSRLTDLMRELAEEQKIPLWGMLGGTALKLMRRCLPPPQLTTHL